MQAKPHEPVLLTIDAGGTSVRSRLQQGLLLLCDDWVTASRPDGHPPSFGTKSVSPDVVVAGITKFSRPGVIDAWKSALSSHYPTAQHYIVPDFELAAAAALNRADSVLLLAGTGSLACAYDDTKLIRIGGRGWEYGDEGSGAFITTEVVRRCVRGLDGMLSLSDLHQSVIALSSVHDAGGFAGWARDQATAHGRGFLVPHVSHMATIGDTEAINLFHGAGGWLARLAHTAQRQTTKFTGSIVICAVGGLWDAGPFLQDATIRALSKWYEIVEFSRFEGSHLSGGRRWTTYD